MILVIIRRLQFIETKKSFIRIMTPYSHYWWEKSIHDRSIQHRNVCTLCQSRQRFAMNEKISVILIIWHTFGGVNGGKSTFYCISIMATKTAMLNAFYDAVLVISSDIRNFLFAIKPSTPIKVSARLSLTIKFQYLDPIQILWLLDSAVFFSSAMVQCILLNLHHVM